MPHAIRGDKLTTGDEGSIARHWGRSNAGTGEGARAIATELGVIAVTHNNNSRAGHRQISCSTGSSFRLVRFAQLRSDSLTESD